MCSVFPSLFREHSVHPSWLVKLFLWFECWYMAEWCRLSVRTVINSRLTYVSKLAFESNLKLQYLWVNTLYNASFMVMLFYDYKSYLTKAVLDGSSVLLRLITPCCLIFASRNLKDNNLSTLSWRIFHHLNISYLWVQYQYSSCSAPSYQPSLTLWRSHPQVLSSCPHRLVCQAAINLQAVNPNLKWLFLIQPLVGPGSYGDDFVYSAKTLGVFPSVMWRCSV